MSALSTLDSADIDALMQMNQACLKVLLDPTLWFWMTAFTVVSIVGGALIGRLKGRMTAGIIWAAVLGPIGWIVIALGRSRLQACPECAKPNQPDALACRQCGANLKQAMQRTARSRLKAGDSSAPP
ncbi:MAG: zinc ribbon domain-containing protein [Dokdonella sp.]